jgi:hypothetical protein
MCVVGWSQHISINYKRICKSRKVEKCKWTSIVFPKKWSESFKVEAYNEQRSSTYQMLQENVLWKYIWAFFLWPYKSNSSCSFCTMTVQWHKLPLSYLVNAHMNPCRMLNKTTLSICVPVTTWIKFTGFSWHLISEKMAKLSSHFKFHTGL